MSDEVFESSEMNLIRNFSDYQGIDDHDYDMIKKVLILKNNLNIL